MTNWVIRGHPRLERYNHTLRSKDKNDLARCRGGRTSGKEFLTRLCGIMKLRPATGNEAVTTRLGPCE